MALIVPVILSGGMGTRLWPLSREDCPKQFTGLVGDHTLLQQTVLRLAGLEVESPIVVCNQTHGATVLAQFEALGVTPQAVLLESRGRNTAPAVAAAAHFLRLKECGSGQVLLVLPADHVILDSVAFAEAVQVAARAAGEGYLTTFGIVPDRPETGYGYVKRGARYRDYFAVERFVEKPDLESARQHVASGEYLWNSGMFAFTVDNYLAELQRLQPEMARQVSKAVAKAEMSDGFVKLEQHAFSSCPSDSIDYAVMEKTAMAAVVPLDAGWSDVGSWSAVADLQDPDAAGNTTSGDVVLHDCHNSHFQSSGRLITGVGVQDLIVVETSDAVLVVHRDRAQDVKALVETLRRANRGELTSCTDEETGNQ